MRPRIGEVVELAGIAAVIIGFIIGARHLRVELPLLFGLAAIFVGRYLRK